jgi:hypothetical protein
MNDNFSSRVKLVKQKFDDIDHAVDSEGCARLARRVYRLIKDGDER